MSILGDNLRALRMTRGDGRDITQQEIADIAGVSRETVNKWESGAISNIRDSNIDKLRSHFNLSVDDLRSETCGLSSQLRDNGIGIRHIPVTSGHRATVPLLTLGRVHAGDLTDEEEVAEEVDVPASVAQHHPHAFALVVEGDCMDRVVLEGYHVLVDPDVEPHNGSVVVAELEPGRAVMRRWLKGQDTLVLSADSHSRHEDIVVTLEDDPVRVVGTVVWAQTAEEME